MGNFASNLKSIIFSKEKIRILMVGLDFAGKNTIFYKLKFGDNGTTIPTNEFNFETVKHNINFSMWNVGGDSNMDPKMRRYFVNTRAVIFVVDSNDRDRIAEASEELHRILRERELQKARLLVFANKQARLVHPFQSIASDSCLESRRTCPTP